MARHYANRRERPPRVRTSPFRDERGNVCNRRNLGVGGGCGEGPESTPCRPLFRVERGSGVGQIQSNTDRGAIGSSAPSAVIRGTASLQPGSYEPFLVAPAAALSGRSHRLLK